MNTRNRTIPGRMKPAQHKIYALADEAAELAKTVECEPWRKLAMRAAVKVSQSSRVKFAEMYLERIHGLIDKSRRYGKNKA